MRERGFVGRDQILLTGTKFLAESQLLKLVYVKFMFVQVVSGLCGETCVRHNTGPPLAGRATKNKRQSAREGEHV